MARFNFRLQGYLNVKEKIEEQKKLEFGKAVKKLEEEREKKRRLEKAAADGFVGLREEMERGISAESFIRYKQYLVQLEREIIRQEGEIKKARNFSESKRVELLGAMKQRKMASILKENDYAEHLNEEKKAEQKLVDEVVSYRYGNRDE